MTIHVLNYKYKLHDPQGWFYRLRFDYILDVKIAYIFKMPLKVPYNCREAAARVTRGDSLPAHVRASESMETQVQRREGKLNTEEHGFIPAYGLVYPGVNRLRDTFKKIVVERKDLGGSSSNYSRPAKIKPLIRSIGMKQLSLEAGVPLYNLTFGAIVDEDIHVYHSLPGSIITRMHNSMGLRPRSNCYFDILNFSKTLNYYIVFMSSDLF